MSTKVQLPPGCTGFDCKDGTKYTGKPGGVISVDDRHANAINKSQFGGDANLVSARNAWSFGTRDSRVCKACNRVWNSWSVRCPRCNAETVYVEHGVMTGPS